MTNRLPVLVDFDGTLAEALWTPENPTKEIGAPIKRNIVKVRELHRAGWHVWIHTARPSSDTMTLADWLVDHDVPFEDIITDKPLGAAYVDDLAIHESEASWVPRNAVLALKGAPQDADSDPRGSELSAFQGLGA